jgi:ABC-type antimicrobial peptide transport system permease subunit
MKFRRIIQTALQALRRNPMRAMLTTLGIIIGVASVIAMMEIGNGSATAIQRTISSMGANNLIIMSGTAASGGVSFGSGSVMTLTPQDCDALQRECPTISGAAPIVRARTQAVYGNRNWVPMFIYGTTPEFLEVRDWTSLDAGEMFTDQDVRNGSKVCVLGQTLVRELFGDESPLGREIRVQNVAFQVVGVLSSKGANMMGMDQDDILLAPWTSIKYRVTGTPMSSNSQGSNQATAVNSLNQLYPSSQVNLYPVPSATQTADNPVQIRFPNLDQILVATASARETRLAIRQITDLLRERHRIHVGDADDFSIRDMTEMTKSLTTTTTLMTNLLLSVALISLIVGGVGIMNIMMVSVTERTREIGLRMSVGARARDILWQFLVEAVVLCLAGGAIGILLGCGGSYLVTLLLRWPTETSLPAILASFLVSAGVGIIFGFYPAWKASRMDPIDALHYE